MQCELSLLSFVTVLSTVFCDGLAEDAVLDVEPYWSTFFIGESVTFKCDMNEGQKNDWEYKIQKDGQAFVHYNTHEKYTLSLRHRGDKGQYQCFGRNKYDSQLIKKSNTVNLSISAGKPKAQIQAEIKAIPVGGNVTLICSVSPSSGWKYSWYRLLESSRLLTAQDAVFHVNGKISVSQGGLYWCKGGRGNPVYYSEDSDAVTIDQNDVALAEIPVVHGKVGGIVELLPNVSTKNVTDARWKYGDATVADTDGFFPETQFTGRSELDLKNFALTIRDLTLGDSGDFQFIYEVNDEQQPTIFITLQVHEPITIKPTMSILNFTRIISNEFCTVLLECSSASDNVNYIWTVGTQSLAGSRLQYIINEEAGFTCTVYNPVSEKSAFKIITCRNEDLHSDHISSVVLIVGLIVGVLIIGLLIILLHCWKLKDLCCNRGAQPETVHQGETQLQVYSSLQYGDQNVYETLSGNEEAQQGCQ
ncbi:Fc receptor-like protein 5 isoform 3-T3 [Pholidichthys leucotaenia]